jgi:hypothetical protein
MLAQVYPIINKFENIPQNLLNDMDKMGIDECLLLTDLEGKYFNALSLIEEKGFNLCTKKVCFLTGNIGSIKSNKKEYFIEERERLKVADYSRLSFFGFLYIFNTAQKAESGGYDATIVYGSKKKLSIKEVIERLKKKQ